MKSSETETIIAYHFTGDTLRDGSPIPKIGEWLEHNGPVIPCESGLHASEHPFDALRYAPGNMLHLVELGGEILKHGDPVDKLAASRRKILKSFNAEKLLRDFARWNALQAIHLWNAPDVVKKYLETGDESLRAAAVAAAWDAAWDAAWYAAAVAAEWDAAWDAAWYAARDAARDGFINESRAKFKEMVDAEFAKL